MKISVIICAHTEKRWDDLIEAVQSVKRQSLSCHQLIVVIDHNPALYERAKAYFTGVELIENHEANGLSGARNSGMAVAKGEVIAFIDDDAVAEIVAYTTAEARLSQRVATRCAQLFIERGGYAVAPVALGHEHHATATAAGADVTRDGARIVLG